MNKKNVKKYLNFLGVSKNYKSKKINCEICGNKKSKIITSKILGEKINLVYYQFAVVKDVVLFQKS